MATAAATVTAPCVHSFSPRLRFSSPPRPPARSDAFRSPQPSSHRSSASPAVPPQPSLRRMGICWSCTGGSPQSKSEDGEAAIKDTSNADSKDRWAMLKTLISKPRSRSWILPGLIIVASFVSYKAIPEVYRISNNVVKALSLTSQEVISTSSATVQNVPASFKLSVFGHDLLFGGRTPGWLYFILLMAAGFGLFVSEEALNVWVGASLARCLTWNSSREAFFNSLTGNASYIVSTILWVYWGVCISDMVPFFAGKFAAKTKFGDAIRQKLGISKDSLKQLSSKVQRYGDLIGFVERFSLGVRNPTSFVAGALGVSPSRFFIGVCIGGLFTLPIQLTIGCLLREQPTKALAGVAAIVGAWTLFPYIAAGLGSLIYIIFRWFHWGDGT